MIVTILKNSRSRSAMRLTQALRAALPNMRVSSAISNSVRRTRGTRFVLNWGVSDDAPRIRQRQLIVSNTAASVAICQNKIATLQSLTAAQIPCVEWRATPTNQARMDVDRWIQEDGKIVVRHTTTGHSGQGIEIFRRQQLARGEDVPVVPLYTRYFRKHAEYRVHVAFGNVILIQQKRKENGRENGDDFINLVRTRGNGWVFTVNDLSCDRRNYRDALCQLAISAARTVGVRHAAVDILSNHDTNTHIVVELNSAPALEADSSLNAYVQAFTNEIRRVEDMV